MGTIGAGEGWVMAGTCLALVVQMLVPVGLFFWGRRVAQRRGNTRAWRILSALPLVALLLGPAGLVVGVATLVLSFGVVAHVDAASRATMLARGISQAMNLMAFSWGLSLLLFVVAISAFVYGSFARPPA
jgi:hypothetical protein